MFLPTFLQDFCLFPSNVTEWWHLKSHHCETFTTLNYFIQGMQEIRHWLLGQKNNNASMSCLVIIIIGYPMRHGWLLDRYKRKAFSLLDLCVDLDKNEDLEGKPKLVILQQYVEGMQLMIKDRTLTLTSVDFIFTKLELELN